jgi:DNA-binding MarR family transcriptional regulator
MARDSTSSLAREVWTLMFDYLIRTGPQRTRSLAKRGLTPNDSRALFSLNADEGRTMRALAESWECDPSNATWIVDRLETLGLAERRSQPGDRRVKLVVLTRKGLKTRAALLDEFHTPPPELAALDRSELEDLKRVLTTLMGTASSPARTPAIPSART